MVMMMMRVMATCKIELSDEFRYALEHLQVGLTVIVVSEVL